MVCKNLVESFIFLALICLIVVRLNCVAQVISWMGSIMSMHFFALDRFMWLSYDMIFMCCYSNDIMTEHVNFYFVSVIDLFF